MVRLAAVAAVAALAGCGGDAANETVPPPTVVAEPPAASSSVCVERWNDPLNVERSRNAGRVFTVAPTEYVSVGFSATFPDRCLVTAVNPDTTFAVQFRQAEFGFQRISPDGLSASSLHGTFVWNARMDDDGMIELR